MEVRLSAVCAGRHFTIQKQYHSASGTHSYQRLSKPNGLALQEGLGQLTEIIRLIGSGTHDLPTCSVVLQPLRYSMSRCRCIRCALQGWTQVAGPGKA
jgi:hypothetical protein